MMSDGNTWLRFMKLKCHKALIMMCGFDQKGGGGVKGENIKPNDFIPEVLQMK